MSTSHKNIADSQRHEPKGISGAAADTVYVADGAGSGAWTNIIADVNNANRVILTRRIPDVSTAGSYFVTNPILGDIIKMYITIDNAITVADATVTLEIGGVLVTGSSCTVAFTGSAAGSVFSSTPSANNTVAAGGSIEIITDGGSTTACEATVTLVIDTE